MRLIQFVVTIVISILTAVFTAKLCTSRWEGKFIKTCIAGCVLSVLTTVISVVFNGLGMLNVQAIFLFCVFFYASYGDIKTHEADDFIHIIVLAVALIGKSAEQMPAALFSAIGLGGILLLVAFIPGTNVGGADIKFVAASAFLTTFEGGLLGLGIGTLAALLFNSPFSKKEGAGKGFPMLPYLSCSYMIVYLLFK